MYSTDFQSFLKLLLLLDVFLVFLLEISVII